MQLMFWLAHTAVADDDGVCFPGFNLDSFSCRRAGLRQPRRRPMPGPVTRSNHPTGAAKQACGLGSWVRRWLLLSRPCAVRCRPLIVTTLADFTLILNKFPVCKNHVRVLCDDGVCVGTQGAAVAAEK